jgi:hypothetical protein
MPASSPNPFEVLRLDPTTPGAEVVRVAGRLRQQATDEATISAIRQAVQALTGAEEERRLHELRTHARPSYQWTGLEQFVVAFGRPPQPAEGPASTCFPSDLEELVAMLPPVLAQELAPLLQPREPTGTLNSPKEIRKQLIEALWRCLRFDSRA